MPVPHPPEWALRSVLTAHPDPAVWAFEVRDPNDGPLNLPDGTKAVLRVTPDRIPLKWGTDGDGAPLIWDPYPIRFGEIEVDSNGSVPEIRLTAANSVKVGASSPDAADAAFINPSVGALLLQHNDYLSDHRVLMHLVQTQGVIAPIHLLTVYTTVIDSSVTWDAITLTLSNFNLVNFDTPQALITEDSCQWGYRSAGCGFIGDPDSSELGPCPKTFEACEARGAHEEANGLTVLHPLRFRSFPGVARGTIRVGL